MELFSSAWLSALLPIVLIDLVLAGDNAIVIALAARNLPAHLQRRAIALVIGIPLAFCALGFPIDAMNISMPLMESRIAQPAQSFHIFTTRKTREANSAVSLSVSSVTALSMAAEYVTDPRSRVG